MISDEQIGEEIINAIYRIGGERLDSASSRRIVAGFHSIRDNLPDELRRYDHRVMERLEVMVRDGTLTKQSGFPPGYETTEKSDERYKKITKKEEAF